MNSFNNNLLPMIKNKYSNHIPLDYNQLSNHKIKQTKKVILPLIKS